MNQCVILVSRNIKTKNRINNFYKLKINQEKKKNEKQEKLVSDKKYKPQNTKMSFGKFSPCVLRTLIF